MPICNHKKNKTDFITKHILCIVHAQKTQTQYFTGQNNKILINNEKNAILLLL